MSTAGTDTDEQAHSQTPSRAHPIDAGAPRCLLCGESTILLYRSNVPNGARIESDEVACTSPHLAVHDDIFHCRRCGLARSVPPPDEDIEALYRDVEDPLYFASEDERRDEFRRALESIESHEAVASPGRVIEIGSAVGLFLDEASKRGWAAVGIEPSRWAAEQARALGANVFNGTLDEFQPESESPESNEEKRFDVVVSWDVWEHLPDPMGALERAFELVRPGGLLVLTTVNMKSLGARLLRSRWPWFMRMHLHYFTPESAAEMVRRAGFERVRTSSRPKILKLGYLVERASRMLGPLGSPSRWLVSKLGLAAIPVRVDLGDILLVEARRPAAEKTKPV